MPRIRLKELWICRGGFIDMAETGEEGVSREVKEETGMGSEKGGIFILFAQYICVYSGFTVHTLDLFFRCTVTDTLHYQAMDDAADVFFLPLKDIHTEDFGLSSIRKGVGIFLKEMGE
ncbi:MAG: NUDIX domain-containing protein [Bacteroides cellulosilyticus]